MCIQEISRRAEVATKNSSMPSQLMHHNDPATLTRTSRNLTHSLRQEGKRGDRGAQAGRSVASVIDCVRVAVSTVSSVLFAYLGLRPHVGALI
jgi:hypothetical protein